jgi:hypothetical protein
MEIPKDNKSLNRSLSVKKNKAPITPKNKDKDKDKEKNKDKKQSKLIF